MNKDGVVSSDFISHLTDGFEEWLRFDVANGPANLDDDDVGVVRNLANGILDLIGDVGNDSNRFPEIIASPLFLDGLER